MPYIVHIYMTPNQIAMTIMLSKKIIQLPDQHKCKIAISRHGCYNTGTWMEVNLEAGTW